MTYLNIIKPNETMRNIFEPFEALFRTDFFDESFFSNDKSSLAGIQTRIKNEKDHIDAGMSKEFIIKTPENLGKFEQKK